MKEWLLEEKYNWKIPHQYLFICNQIYYQVLNQNWNVQNDDLTQFQEKEKN